MGALQPVVVGPGIVKLIVVDLGQDGPQEEVGLGGEPPLSHLLEDPRHPFPVPHLHQKSNNVVVYPRVRGQVGPLHCAEGFFHTPDITLITERSEIGGLKHYSKLPRLFDSRSSIVRRTNRT